MAGPELNLNKAYKGCFFHIPKGQLTEWGVKDYAAVKKKAFTFLTALTYSINSSTYTSKET